MTTKRTSRRRDPENDDIGVHGGDEVKIHPTATVRDVVLLDRTSLTVGAGANVKKLIEDRAGASTVPTVTIKVGERAHILSLRRTQMPFPPSEITIEIGPRAHLDHVTIHPTGEETAFVIHEGAKLTSVKMSGSLGTVGHDSVLTDVRHFEDSHLGAGCTVNAASLEKADVGDECSVEAMSELTDTSIGRGTTIGGRTSIRAGKVGERCRIGAGVHLDPDSAIGHEVIIEDEISVGDRTVIGDRSHLISADEDGFRITRIGVDVKIGAGTTIGRGAKIADQVNIGAGVTIGLDCVFEKYAVVAPGVKIGNRVVVRSGARVRQDVEDGRTVDRAVVETGQVTVHATSESWMLGRVADAMEEAGQKRLDKRVLAKSLPTLVDTFCVKQLLRMAPPPDVATLREMSKAFSCAPKYEGQELGAEARRDPPPYVATIHAKGWSGMQTMGVYDNDVLIFKAPRDVLDTLAPEDSSWRDYFRFALMTLGKTDSHPGGGDERLIGWARLAIYEDERSMLCEEIQTDLAFLAWDPSMEVWYLADEQNPRIIAGTSEEHAFHFDDAVAHLLTSEGVSARRWRDYVERHPRANLIPTFTKDKDKQQKALLATLFWRAAREVSNDHNMSRLFRFVAVHQLGLWDEFWKYNVTPSNPVRSPDRLKEVEQAQAEWPSIAIEMISDARDLFSDFYESALAGVLQVARSTGLREVWVPDYETKYAIAAYSGGEGATPLEPPRSVYTELPKKFGVTQVEPLPKYMDTREWKVEAAERRGAPWVRVKIPDAPRGRRLLANRRT